MFLSLEVSSPAKEKIVNENFLIQEAWNKGIIDRTLSTPPTTPSSDGLYIPMATATGAWAGNEDKLLWWNPTGAWQVIEVTGKFKLPLQNEPAYYVFNGTWNLERYQTTVYEGIADMTALNTLTGMIAGDHSEVLDADGFGTPGWFIYGTSWRQIG